MSASSPDDGRATALPSLPAQSAPSAVATPAEVVAESTLDTNIMPTREDSPLLERHAMSFEEFRQFYVASRRSNYLSSQSGPAERLLHQDSGGVPAHGTGGASASTDQAAGQLDMVGTRRRRIIGTSNEGTRSAQTAATAAAATPPPAAQVPPAPPGLLSRGVRSIGVWANRLANRVMRDRAHLLQLLLVFFVLFVHVKLSSAHLICLLVLYLTVKGAQVLLHSFQVSHETGTTGAPSLLGRLFKPEGHVGPVSKLRKIGYMVAKCVEAFLLSFFPTYSLEHLERELGTDGIVR